MLNVIHRYIFCTYFGSFLALCGVENFSLDNTNAMIGRHCSFNVLKSTVCLTLLKIIKITISTYEINVT